MMDVGSGLPLSLSTQSTRSDLGTPSSRSELANLSSRSELGNTRSELGTLSPPNSIEDKSNTLQLLNTIKKVFSYFFVVNIPVMFLANLITQE